MERKPDWLKVPYNKEAVAEVAALMKDLKLNTVCKEAKNAVDFLNDFLR